MSLCDTCNGACCRYMIMNHATGLSADEKRWTRYHGCDVEDARRVIIPLKCRYLDEKGHCAIHDRKPEMCRLMRVGGDVCLSARKHEGIK